MILKLYLCTRIFIYINIMATYGQVVYYVLDSIKSTNGDNFITEDHVIYLANHYRLVLLEQEKLKNQLKNLLQSNYQTICLDLEQVQAIPDMDICNETYLRSKDKVPSMIDSSLAKIYPYDYFYAKNISYVTRDRFKFVGNDKYLYNIIYCTLGLDNYLYFKSANPQFLYMQQAKLSGIFEDATAASELSCEDESSCDIMDKEFPLQGSLLVPLQDAVIKELYQAEWRQEDNVNNAKDDLANLINYIHQNSKSTLAKQLE